MRSIRKAALLVAACAAMVVVALPATSNAAQLRTAKNLVPVNSVFAAKSINPVWESSWGTFSCESMTVQSKVTVNNSYLVETWNNSASTSKCFIEGEPITVDVERFGLKLEGPNSGVAKLSFLWHLPAGITCRYYSDSVPVTYKSGSSFFKISEAELKVAPEACGEVYFSADFSLTDTSGNPLYLY